MKKTAHIHNIKIPTRLWHVDIYIKLTSNTILKSFQVLRICEKKDEQHEIKWIQMNEKKKRKKNERK